VPPCAFGKKFTPQTVDLLNIVTQAETVVVDYHDHCHDQVGEFRVASMGFHPREEWVKDLPKDDQVSDYSIRDHFANPH
jgi:hypothetical protein